MRAAQGWLNGYLRVGLICTGHLAMAASITNTPSADTTLFEQFPSNNMGKVPTLIVGGIAADLTGFGIRARALLKFDLTNNVPANALVTSVTLRLKVENIPPDPRVDGVVELRRLLRPWGEGNKTTFKAGDPATFNEATWLDRFARVAGTRWSTPGGNAPADYSEGASSSVFIADDFFYTFPSTSNLVADVQLWIREPSLNFGWIIISQVEESPRSARRYASRDDIANPSSHPRLVIDFTVPALFQPRIEMTTITNNLFKLTATAHPGATYRLEGQDILSAGPWVTLTNLTARDTNLTFTNPVVGRQRFYRIAVSP